MEGTAESTVRAEKAPERPIVKLTKTKEERSQIAREAATKRWRNARRAQAKGKGKGKAAAKKKPSGPREFTSALKTAEKRLAKAIQERAEAGAKYAILSAEIPSLQRIIAALKNPIGAEYLTPVGMPYAPPTLEQIVGDQPLGYQNPPSRPQPPAQIPVPPAQHPVNTQGRAQGGAIGVELVEDDNENKFLEESGVAGGQWH